MKLQTRLVLAFFLLAVVPLAGLTLQGWISSQRAFRQAVEAEAGDLAAEMGERVERVTADLSERIGQLEDLPFEDVSIAGEAARVSREQELLTGVESAMGDAARWIEALEFVPDGAPEAPPAPEADSSAPAAPLSPVAPAPEGAAAPAVAPDGLGRILVVRPVLATPPAPGEPPLPLQGPGATFELDLSEIPARWEQFVDDPEALEAGRRLEKLAREHGLDKRLEEVAQQVEAKIAEAERTEADGARRLFLGIARQALDATHKEMKHMLGRDFSVVVKRAGAPVGRVQARIRTEELLTGVLGQTRRAQGEIPFAIDAGGRLLTPDPDDLEQLRELGVEQGHLQGASPPGDWVLATRRDAETGLTLGVARPVGPALQEIRNTAMRNLVYGLVLVGVAILGIVPLSRRMTRDLGRLADGARAAAHGNLAVRVPIDTSDEIGDLARAFNQMTEDLEVHQGRLVAQERLAKEVELSRRIQEELLPRGSLRLPFAEVLGVSVPAREVGGDFYNYFELGDGSLALLVGDVSGKGVGAALLMANVQATLRARLPHERDLAALAELLDREIDASTPRAVFLTLFLATFDAGRGELCYVNAGHNPPILLGAEGDASTLDPTGRPLGLLPGGGYEQKCVPVERGGLLFFFTDGLVENENEAGEPFGDRRLLELVQGARGREPAALLAGIEEAARAFRGSHEADDDATMMIFKLGSGAA